MPDRAAPPSLWKPIAGRALETALNRGLALDEATRDAVAKLDGRSVALILASPPLALRLQVEGDRLRVGPVGDDDAPDLAVRSTLGGLLSQLPAWIGSGSRRDDTPPAGRLRIEGDAELARQLQRLVERFDPDWQQPFAAMFGDVLGVQIANACADALRQARSAGAGLAESAAEYVVEESRDVVGRDELNAFHDDVDALRDDAERLAARVRRLQPQQEPGA